MLTQAGGHRHFSIRAIRAEERWTNDGNRLIGLGYPQILNTVSIPVGLYGLYAAYKRKPISAVVFPLASQGLNQWCMNLMSARLIYSIHIIILLMPYM